MAEHIKQQKATKAKTAASAHAHADPAAKKRAAPPKKAKAAKPEKRRRAASKSWATRWMRRISLTLQSRWVGVGYAIFALLVLTASTVFWAVLGARVQSGNADHLVNAYLFENRATLHGATFPGQHTFLLKWPVFWLIELLHASSGAYLWVTVGLALATVLLFAALLLRIVRRPVMFGTLCLALASVLLAVPAQPYPGGLLPVNMAMDTTRNIEYIIYIACLALLVRWPSFKRWQFWAAVALMSLLVASDKLFLTFGVSAMLIAGAAYAVRSKWPAALMSAKGVVLFLAGAAGAAALLAGVQAAHITHIASQSTLGPYGVVHRPKDVLLGTIFAGLSTFTNLGASPASDPRVLPALPAQLPPALLGWGGLAFLVNGLLLALGIYAACRLVWGELRHRDVAAAPHTAAKLSMLLLATAVAAAGIFIVSNHYYPVDARYLAIVLFALFVAGACYVRRLRLPAWTLAAAGLVLLLSCASGLHVALRNYQAEQAALAPFTHRNQLIAQALGHRPVSVLVGDYWRVVPIKYLSPRPMRVLPLAGCVQPEGILNSTAWQPDITQHSFAYLLSLDKGLTGYPRCQIKQVVAAYGRPNASIVVDGNLSNPKELLLLYDRGSRKSAPAGPTTPAQAPPTVVPIAPAELPYKTCTQPTVMTVVAHQDDDLLFTNPSLYHAIQAGNCVRSVYVTAGDAGVGSFYWLSREQGSEAAYSAMLGTNVLWVHRVVKLSDHEYITVANPRGNAAVSLIFMHLPDGNVNGKGFAASHFESLARLEAGNVPSIQSVDGSSSYTTAELTDALVQLMQLYRPSEVHTQSEISDRGAPDHSDHNAVGRFAKQAYLVYQQTDEQTQGVPLYFYLGYPDRRLPQNVFGQDLEDKQRIFFEYARFDTGVCQSPDECARNPNNYQFYLSREYQEDR